MKQKIELLLLEPAPNDKAARTALALANIAVTDVEGGELPTTLNAEAVDLTTRVTVSQAANVLTQPQGALTIAVMGRLARESEGELRLLARRELALAALDPAKLSPEIHQSVVSELAKTMLADTGTQNPNEPS